jgi:gliding motility-associated lipoprotein GldH
MTRTTSSYLLLVIISGLLVCCGSGKNIVFIDTETIPDNIWSLQHVPQFEVSINDTVSFNNITFSIRTGSSYPFRNLWLFITTTAPNGNSLTDTLEYKLADEKGNWYGKGFGDIHELDLPYRQNVFFPVKGMYVFRIRHGMRAENLKGVYDIGLRVEKITK